LPGDNSQFPRHPADQDKKTINLAELQVFHGDQNIALRKKARQSSTLYAPENAVDGNTVGNDQGNPYAHTTNEDNPWWEVDLGSEQPIDRIVIWNRSGGSDSNLYYARMNHFRVRVLDPSRKVVFEQVVDKAPSPSSEIIPDSSFIVHPSSFIVRLPRSSRNDAPSRYRVSVAPQLTDLGPEEKRLAVLKLTDPWLKIAAAYATNGRTDEALPYFGKALQRAGGYTARKTIVELAARFDVLAALIQRQPDDPELRLALARNLTARGKTALAAEKPAAALADLRQAQDIITRLLRPVGDWTVLTPVEVRTETGAKLELQKDGSVFAHRPPRNDTYSLTFQTNLKGIKSLRLEALADSRIPGGGPGWDGTGNFVLSELTLEAASADGLNKARSVGLRNASADFSQGGWDVRGAVDGNSSTGWAIWPEVNRDHVAVFDLAEEVGDGQATRLTVRLHHHFSDEKFLLGRFRLSFTNDAARLHATRIRLDLKENELVEFYVAPATAFVQQGQIDEAVTVLLNALGLIADRTAKAKIIAAAAPLKGVLEKLAQRAAGDALFQAELARHFAERGNAPLAEAARTKARTLMEDKLAKEPENTALAAELADLLLIDTGSKWTVLKPTDMKSQGGATLTELEDHSILVGGANPNKDTFTFVTQTRLPKIKALRLEALAHESLGNGGPGRVAHGNFALSEISVKAEALSGGGKAGNLKLINPHADFEQDWNPVAASLDGKPDTAWGVYPYTGKDHVAVFEMEPSHQAAFGGGTKLTVTLDFQTSNNQHALGRFRLSVCGDPGSLQQVESRFAVGKVADPWARLAAAYHVLGDKQALDNVVKHHPEAAAGVGDMYASRQDWKRALAEYDKAIASGSKDARIFAARAEAYEKLEKWELAAADWGNADLYASDKKVRFGNASRPALEHRALIYAWHLQQFDKEVQDCTELLKPERLGANPWTFNLRGEAYERLRQWDKALADFDQAVKVCQPNERENFQFFRARHFAARGQWRQAADEMRALYQKPANNEWWRLRDAALIFAVAGDVENYGKAAAECYGKQSAGSSNPDDNRWAVLTMLLIPEMITGENRARLLELAAKTDAYWQPRLTAAIQFRGGDDKKAVELFDANGGGPQFSFLAAMVHKKIGNVQRAKQLLDEGNSWVREQRAKDLGAGVPQTQGWQDWATVVALQYEASDLILGPPPPPSPTGGGRAGRGLPERAVGDAQFQAALAQHLAARGNAAAANAARAKARALLERQLAAKPDNVAPASELVDLLWSTLPPVEYIWIDDAAPPGANLQGDTPWEFVSGPEHPVFRGKKSMRRQVKGLSQHFFDGAAPGLKIGEGGRLFAYVYLDPKDPPKAVMLQFKNGSSWEHRAFWGEDLIPWGEKGKESHVAMGPLPTAGVWFRLEVEAAKVGLTAGAVLNGWAFTQHGGTCYWDAAGYTRAFETPWQKLAAAYHRLGDQQALEKLVKQHPEAAASVGDLYAATQDWERAIAEYRKLVDDQPADVALLTKLAAAYQSAGRTREAIPYLARASAANPQDTIRSLEVAARQAWFGQEKEFAATRQRILAFAKGTSSEFTANQAAKACSIRASTDKAELEAALALGRTAVELGKDGNWKEWNLLALGMAEYRSGNDGAALEALLAAAQAASNNPHVTGTAAFYQAMSLFRQGKRDEARKLAIAAAAKMKTLPRDDKNPLADGADHNDLIQWLAYKEARTLLKIDLSPIEILEEARLEEVKTLGSDHPTTIATTNKLADAYVAGGRTRESVPLLASASAANPKDTWLSIKVAALQAWFGQEKQLAATRQRILAFAKGTNDAGVADYAAKSCSILPFKDKAELEAALALGRTAAKLDKGSEWRDWRLLAQGMAEYRSGNDAAAAEALRAAAEAGLNPRVKAISAFYRAMILFRQGKADEARKLATLAAAKMKPLPADEQNPLTGDAYYDDLVLWLAYKEAKAMLKFDAAPAASWLMRALADHRRGETNQAKKACGKAAAMLKLAGADEALRPLLRQTVLALGTDSPEARELIAAAAGKPPATLNQAIQQNPHQANGYRERGNWYAERGQWKDAIADYAQVFRLDANTLDAMRLGFLLAYSGEKQRFREHGQAVLHRWASTEKNDEADQTLKTIILIPDYKADAKQLARLAEAAVAGDRTRDWYEWWLMAKALHDVRTGRYADAVTACRASRQRAPESKGEPQVLTALDLVIEALALQGAGQADQARRTLDQAKALIESHVPGIDGDDWWSDWLSAHLLYREAVGQIAAKKAEPKIKFEAAPPAKGKNDKK
jgi:tetratricopeptide (TPR) repeat protein